MRVHYNYSLYNRMHLQLQNTAITEAMEKAITAYKCKSIEGWTSHQMRQGDPEKEDGTRLTLNPGEQLKKDLEKSKLELHDVFAVDIAVSTADGKVYNKNFGS